MSAQRTSKSATWGTPDNALAGVRACLGEIGLDPCSSAEHNERVGARVYFDERRDGLKQCWRERGHVFVNPPGSSRGVQPWWAKFSEEVLVGIWLGFNMNQFAYLEPNPLLHADWIFIPRKRIRYVGAGENPPHNSYFAGVGCSGTGMHRAMEGTLVELREPVAPQLEMAL